MRGFTLIEFIIYIAILVVLLALIIGFLWSIILGNIKETSYQEVQQNARFALIKITQEIKKAVGINSPVPGDSTSTLSLAMASTSSDPTFIGVANGKLRITKGSSEPQELTTDLVIVDDLQFTNLSYFDTPGTIQIEMTINHLNPGERLEYQASIDLKSTVSLIPGGAAFYCTGAPFPCDQFPDQTACQSQEGCSWLDPFCGGTCTSCRGLSQTQCNQQDGCTWFWFFCRGNCTSCGTYTDQPSCQGQLGCSWNPGECSGTPFSCESYGTEEECLRQAGCHWGI